MLCATIVEEKVISKEYATRRRKILTQNLAVAEEMATRPEVAIGYKKSIQKKLTKINEDEYMVLKVEADKDQTKPFYMEGFINGNRFKAMIDTGSPVTIFALDEVKRIMKRNELQVRPMIEDER